MDTRTSVWPPAEIERFLSREMPHCISGPPGHKVEMAENDGALVRLVFDPCVLRPGDTISGAWMMSLADLAGYVALLGALGDKAATAVTTNFAMNFLRKPSPGDLLAEVRMIRRGRRLAVMEIDITGPEGQTLLARGNATYFLTTDAKAD